MWPLLLFWSFLRELGACRDTRLLHEAGGSIVIVVEVKDLHSWMFQTFISTLFLTAAVEVMKVLKGFFPDSGSLRRHVPCIRLETACVINGVTKTTGNYIKLPVVCHSVRRSTVLCCTIHTIRTGNNAPPHERLFGSRTKLPVDKDTEWRHWRHTLPSADACTASVQLTDSPWLCLIRGTTAIRTDRSSLWRLTTVMMGPKYLEHCHHSFLNGSSCARPQARDQLALLLHYCVWITHTRTRYLDICLHFFLFRLRLVWGKVCTFLSVGVLIGTNPPRCHTLREHFSSLPQQVYFLFTLFRHSSVSVLVNYTTILIYMHIFVQWSIILENIPCDIHSNTTSCERMKYNRTQRVQKRASEWKYYGKPIKTMVTYHVRYTTLCSYWYHYHVYLLKQHTISILTKLLFIMVKYV